MLAGCIKKMTARACGTCARHDTCAFVLPEALGFVLSSLGPKQRMESAAASSRFAAFLGEIGKGLARSRPARPKPSVRRAVERELEALLDTGQIGIEAVAHALGCSRQTLYRRLKAEGATFEAVLDGLRRRLALRLIGREGLTVKEAAWRLGYADPAALSRAFKRWTGASPRAFNGGKPR